jgi:hypothetical protein
MKKHFQHKKISLLIFILLIAFSSRAQQQITQTVTAQNRNCNSGCSVIDIPAINNKPAAVIFIRPVTANYSHPIGAYYMYLNRWSVFNLDGTAMVLGTTFNVEYYANPDANHFVYVAPSLVHTNDVRYLDHVGLNNNPKAKVQVFPTNSPPAGVSGANFNSTEVRVDYDLTTSKWFIYNLGNTTVPTGTAYSVKFSDDSLLPLSMPTATSVPVPTPTPGTPGTPGSPYLPPLTLTPPASALPNGPAGGDLTGTYPNPKVIGLQGKPLSNVAPTIGQILKWNGTAWEPAADNVGTASIASSKPSVLYFNQSSIVEMYNPNVNVATISGLDNQTFTLSQSSRIVFHTTIVVESVGMKNSPMSIWLSVEILNSSNAVVAYSSSDALLADQVLQSHNSTGIAILSAGTYRTRVSINRQVGGSKLSVFTADVGYNTTSHSHQGGQIIIEIFPD